MTGPDRDFWESRFAAGDTPWDRGEPNAQLGAWIGSGALKPCRILVPGCGSGHEVAALAKAGFDVTGLDYAAEAIGRTKQRVANAGAKANLVHADALAWKPERAFDAVYEQTCLCALYPDLWRAYADQLFAWIRPGGRLFALFMQAPRPGATEGFIEGPPYHCDVNAMRALLTESRWAWPKPPYARTALPRGMAELVVVLERRNS